MTEEELLLGVPEQQRGELLDTHHTITMRDVMVCPRYSVSINECNVGLPDVKYLIVLNKNEIYRVKSSPNYTFTPQTLSIQEENYLKRYLAVKKLLLLRARAKLTEMQAAKQAEK